MIIGRTDYQDTFRMRYNLGPDPGEENKDILRVRSYTRVKPGASGQDLWSMAKGFEKLFDVELVNTYRVMRVELIED